jgi:adenylosuccinate synthase
MPITVLLGAQWGDEGKGRFVDALAENARIVARYNGGDNAGHSITIGKQVFKLHLLPSGIFRANCLNLLGNGVVVNPRNLLKEMAEVRAGGFEISPANFRISQAAHVILPGHVALDAARESGQTGGFIGTTMRGIGFAYSDKMARTGIRANMMADPERFADAVFEHTEATNKMLTGMGQPLLQSQTLAAEYSAAAQLLKPYLGNTFHIVHAALRAGDTVLAEGAQASLLDIDHGTYPFVTSSNATVGGVLTGLAAPAQAISRVMGVTKAFQTRVGGGPFVTELQGEMALRLRGTGANPWDEYGSTTGRPRRVGWLDLVALRYTAQLNGMTELAVTKLDILSGLPTLNVCVGYRYQGDLLDDFPQDTEVLAKCEPVYEALPGWQADISALRTQTELPSEVIAYLDRISAFVGAPVSIASVGPEREQMIWMMK